MVKCGEIFDNTEERLKSKQQQKKQTSKRAFKFISPHVDTLARYVIWTLTHTLLQC